MNDQAGVDWSTVVFFGNNGWNDAIEWDFDAIEIGIQIQSKREISACQLPGNGDRRASKLVCSDCFSSNDHRAVAIAHTCAAGAKDVFIVQVCVRMDANRR